MNSYLQQLSDINIELVSEFKSAAYTPNTYKCLTCGNVWTSSGTSISAILRSNRKFGTNGCQHCTTQFKKVKTLKIKQEKLDILAARGYTYITDVDSKKVVLRHTCGYEFEYNIYQSNIEEFECKQCFTRNQNKIITDVTHYQDKLTALKIKLISPFTHSSNEHTFQCEVCDTEFTGNFYFKLNTKHPCPTCLKKHQSVIKTDTNYASKLQENNLIKIIGEYKGAAKNTHCNA